MAASLLRETARRKGRYKMLKRIPPLPLLALLNRKSMRVFTVNAVPGLKRDRWTKVRSPWTADARRLYTEAFADSVLAGRRPDISGEEGRKILEAIMAAYHSAHTGTRQLIGDEDRHPPQTAATPSFATVRHFEK